MDALHGADSLPSQAALARLATPLLALLLAGPALAQTQSAPQISIAVEPDGPVTVGTPVEVSVTVLVPTYMPNPPVWPDLQIADAITRLPERATHPVTQRIGQASWSGITRSWEIIPQRAADYELGPARTTITYADPDTNAAVQATLDLPEIAFTATVPHGAEDMDPFLAATSLTVAMTVDGVPAAPKPGDAFVVTLATTAAGPPAMLLPPLVDRLPALAGLRAYPHEPTLADGPTSTRTETLSYVVEAPGRYVLPALSLDWWNTASNSRETARTEAITIDVPTPPGWTPPGAADATAGPRWLVWAILAAIAVLALAAIVARHLRHAPRAPSARSLGRALRRAVRSAPPGTIRARLADWRAALGAPVPPEIDTKIESALRALDRLYFGPAPAEVSERAARRELLHAIAAVPAARMAPRSRSLPKLNPTADA